MADIYYNYAQIEQAVSDMQAGASSLKTRLEDMDAELQQLKESWDGQAKDAYTSSKAQRNEGMDNIIDILSRVATSVSEARQSAEATDARNAGGFPG